MQGLPVLKDLPQGQGVDAGGKGPGGLLSKPRRVVFLSPVSAPRLLHPDAGADKGAGGILHKEPDLPFQFVPDKPPVISLEEGGKGALDQGQEDLCCDLSARLILVFALPDKDNPVRMAFLAPLADLPRPVPGGIVVNEEHGFEGGLLVQYALDCLFHGVLLVVGKEQDGHRCSPEDALRILREDPGPLRETR